MTSFVLFGNKGIKIRTTFFFYPPPTRLTGESWSPSFHCIEAPEDRNMVELDVDRAHITFFNLFCIKSKLGYSGRDYLYYVKRCGRDTASLVAIDFEQQIEAMIENSKEERKVRMLLSKDQQNKLQISITPMKRSRVSTSTDEPTIEEPIDAYKKWLAKLQQEQPDMEFKDDYRDETIKTYKEWLRRQDYLTDIYHESNDVEEIPDEGSLDSQSQSQETNWPSHAPVQKTKEMNIPVKGAANLDVVPSSVLQQPQSE